MCLLRRYLSHGWSFQQHLWRSSGRSVDMKVPACAEEEEAFSQCWKYSTAVFYSLRCVVRVVPRVSSYVRRARRDVVCVA